MQEVVCPVCGSPCRGPALYRYTVQSAAAHFCPESRDADRNRRLVESLMRLWNGNECSVSRCNQCGFGFALPFVAGDEEFYGVLHEQRGYPSWRWDYDVALEHAVPDRAGGRILDIGAGDGTFLGSLEEKWERFAVEGSEATRTELERKGIIVFRDLVSAAETEAGSFDLVTLFQTLEHIAEFREVLEIARKLLAPGGKIFITVPDGDAMIEQERITGCPDMPPNHVCKWTPRSLSLALEGAGFTPGSAVPEPSSFGKILDNLYLKVRADSTRSGSLSEKAYRISRKSARAPLLGILGAFGSLRLLPHLGKLRHGGAFAMAGRVPD